MAFASFDDKRSGSPLAEINMVPLIDVMLVLLVIFMVTAPLLTHSVKLELPKASSVATDSKTVHIDLAIDAEENLHWNGEKISSALAQQKMLEHAAFQPQPHLYLRVDQSAEYRAVATVLADAANAGLTKIGFLSAPTQ